MAQPDDTRRMTSTDASNAPRPQNSPGSKSSRSQTSPHSQYLQGGSSRGSSNSSPKLKKNHDHDDHANHHNKKSVFKKVKEKAQKLKKSLSVRRRREDNESHSSQSAAGPVEDDETEGSEYFGSPLYEPSAAPDIDKQSAKEHPDMSKNNEPSLSSTDANLSGLTISTCESTETAAPDAKEPESSPQNKGVSVKEYLMHKLEPGDDERALCQVISQTISPRRERMKEAVNSLLGNEEPTESTSKTSNLEHDTAPSSSSVASRSLTNYLSLSNTLEPNLSDASNISPCSESTTASLHNQNRGSSSVSSNLKPDSCLRSHQLNLNPNGNATRDPAATSSHDS